MSPTVREPGGGRQAAFRGNSGGSYWCLALLKVWLLQASLMNISVEAQASARFVP